MEEKEKIEKEEKLYKETLFELKEIFSYDTTTIKKKINLFQFILSNYYFEKVYLENQKINSSLENKFCIYNNYKIVSNKENLYQHYNELLNILNVINKENINLNYNLLCINYQVVCFISYPIIKYFNILLQYDFIEIEEFKYILYEGNYKLKLYNFKLKDIHDEQTKKIIDELLDLNSLYCDYQKESELFCKGLLEFINKCFNKDDENDVDIK